MPTMEEIDHTVNAIGLATDCLVEVIHLMRILSSFKYGPERDQIILQIGRLNVLANRISKEDVTT